MIKLNLEFENKDDFEEFFNKNREFFFSSAKITKNYEFLDILKLSKACVTCSCGSLENSCEEDGKGNFSYFFVDYEGSLFRTIVKK